MKATVHHAFKNFHHGIGEGNGAVGRRQPAVLSRFGDGNYNGMAPGVRYGMRMPNAVIDREEKIKVEDG